MMRYMYDIPEHIFSESSNSAHSSPAYLRWAENLHNLLSDPVGFSCQWTFVTWNLYWNSWINWNIFLGWSWTVQKLLEDWKCGGTAGFLVTIKVMYFWMIVWLREQWIICDHWYQLLVSCFRKCLSGCEWYTSTPKLVLARSITHAAL